MTLSALNSDQTILSVLVGTGQEQPVTISNLELLSNTRSTAPFGTVR